MKKTNQINIFMTNSPDMVCKPMIIQNSSLKEYCRANKIEIVTNIKLANNIIFNTCGVSTEAEKQSLELFQNILKEKKPAANIYIIGCLSKINPGIFNSKLNNIHIIKNFNSFNEIFNTNYNFNSSLKITEKYSVNYKNKTHIPKLFFPFKYILPLKSYLFNLSRFKTLYNSALLKDRALIEISTGCTEHCSYCSIKKAKGRLKSYPVAKIIEAIKTIENKPRLLSLVAQDCGSYGLDIGISLDTLLENIYKILPKIPIEISTLNPKWLEKNEDFWLNIFKKYNISEISIPLQSGSNKILKLMNRQYETKNIKNILSKIKKIKPGIFLRTHLIIGFPNENILDYFQSIKSMFWFDHTLAIPFSPRPHTQAFLLSKRTNHFILTVRFIFALICSIFVTSFKIINHSLSKNTSSNN